MEPRSEPLRLFGKESDADVLSWSWADEQLTTAGTYWVVATGTGHPHPRPVWGVWHDHALHLSIGSLVVARQVADEPDITVHLDSGTDVVLIEGRAAGATDDPEIIAAYDTKYDWHYTVDEYGPLTVLRPNTVLAWRSGGWAGREGFEQTGSWGFD